MNILVTGAAGFIGFSLCLKLLEEDNFVIGLDNLNNYYDVKLKEARILKLQEKAKNLNRKFVFIKVDLENETKIRNIFKKYSLEVVVHLAAQAGVRFSVKNPYSYINSNIVGFLNILEGCRNYPVKNFIFASSSSVYGGNTKMPFSESDGVDHPLSLYAASKKSNELMAHSYCSLFNIPTIGLRFFTVYGPWGRPDMALFLFTKAIISGDPIKVFNNGKMLRDFTYIDDVIKSINLLIKKPATSYPFFDKKKPDPSISWVPYKIFNIGNSKPISLMEYINAIEDSLGTNAIIDYQPLQAGDVEATSADISNLVKYINYRPNTSVKVGIGKFVDWYKNFYKIY